MAAQEIKDLEQKLKVYNSDTKLWASEIAATKCKLDELKSKDVEIEDPMAKKVELAPYKLNYKSFNMVKRLAVSEKIVGSSERSSSAFWPGTCPGFCSSSWS